MAYGTLTAASNREYYKDIQYFLLGRTNSSSSTWGFDRFRLYTPTQNTKVRIKDHLGNIVDTQSFSTTNSFEHDFSFNLSGNTGNAEWEIYIGGVPDNSQFAQVYAYPTGWSATRGLDADITYWNLNVVNPRNNGGTEGYLRLNNQPLTNIDGATGILAKYVYLQNCLLISSVIDDVIIGCDNNGQTSGTLDYSNNPGSPTTTSLTAHNNLISKGWAITGPTPA